jgi:hypothetical protein
VDNTSTITYYIQRKNNFSFITASHLYFIQSHNFVFVFCIHLAPTAGPVTTTTASTTTTTITLGPQETSSSAFRILTSYSVSSPLTPMSSAVVDNLNSCIGSCVKSQTCFLAAFSPSNNLCGLYLSGVTLTPTNSIPFPVIYQRQVSG